MANAGTLLVPIYLNRSKIGNLQLLRQFAQQHQLTLAGIGNRTDPLVNCYFDDFLVTSFDRSGLPAGIHRVAAAARPADRHLLPG